MGNAKPTSINLGEKHGLWKGENASYKAKHNWMTRHFGKPKLCEDCKTTTAKRFHWANISGEYKRERSDYKRLCVTCHMKMDKIVDNLGTGMLGKRQNPESVKIRIARGLATRKITKGY